MSEKKFAVIIDAENISYKYIKCMFEELQKYGVATYKRAYGDFSKDNLKGWESVMREFAITPELQYSYTFGKNSSDSKMIIDAMDILYAGRVDGFCIVSSDSDFTGLARRLIESGMYVIGMGEKKSPVSFINACNKFSFLDVIYSSQVSDSDNADNNNKQTADETDNISNVTPEQVIKDTIVKLLADSEEIDGYMNCADIGNMLIKKFPDFDPRNYGYSKLTRLLSSIESVSIVQKNKVFYATLKEPKDKESIVNYICEIVKSSKEPVNIGDIGRKVRKKFASFDIKVYGYSEFSKFISNECKDVRVSGNNAMIKK